QESGMDKEVVFRRFGGGPFGNANNDVTVTAGRLEGGIIEFALVARAWGEAPTGFSALQTRREIGYGLANRGVYVGKGDIKLVDVGDVSILVRIEEVRARGVGSFSLVKFDETSLLRRDGHKAG